jgi:hypothetical protein
LLNSGMIGPGALQHESGGHAILNGGDDSPSHVTQAFRQTGSSVINSAADSIPREASGSNEGKPGGSKAHTDSIVFLCPNGHKLNGPSRLAGRLGQCPHCGMRFQIPPLEEIRALAAAAAQDSPEAAALSSQSGDNASAHPAPDSAHETLAERQIQTGGETPEELAELFAAVRADQERIALQRASAASGIGKANGLGGTESSSAIVSAGGASLASSHSSGGIHGQAQQSPGGHLHPLADLVMRLWEEREHGGIIELHLEGGNLLLPDWFERKLSTKSHGLFATQAADGTVTMTVVPWDTVQRVVIRGVVGLPDGMFE